MEPALRLYFAKIGRKGGKARAKLPKAELSRIGKLGGRPRKNGKSRSAT